MAKWKYQRVLLKISGEGLSGVDGFGLAAEAMDEVAEQILALQRLSVQTAVVVGAGNLIRGASLSKKVDINRSTGDYMGMLATVINALALRDVLIARGGKAMVLSAREITSVCEPFTSEAAISAMEQGKVVILAGGTGNPYFTTDTCAALRAVQIGADVLIKATKVDGVYSADPVKDSSAKLYSTLTFSQVLKDDLRIMDHSAISLCRENQVDIIVCNLIQSGNVEKVVRGESIGTRISDNQQGML